MDTAHPTASWEQLGERFYRKIQLYTQVFDQDLDLDNYIVAGAPYGGAIGERMPAACLPVSATHLTAVQLSTVTKTS
jgi:hypothetical protein